jgi:hypothetical protein
VFAWFDRVLRERRRIAWHHLATALFVPLPTSVVLNAQAAKRLQRRLSEEAGIDLPLVIEVEASLLASERGSARLQDWRQTEAIKVAVRAAPLAPLALASGLRQFDFIVVEASALLALADRPGQEGAAVAGWLRALASHGVAAVASGVGDPRIVPRLVGLGVELATGPGIAAAGETLVLRTLQSANGRESSDIPIAARAASRAPSAGIRSGEPAATSGGQREVETGAWGAPSPVAARLREAGLRAARAPLSRDICRPAAANGLAG